MKRFMFAVMAIAAISFAGCEKDNDNDAPVGNVQKAIDAISDKTSAKSIVISGELTADDWELLKGIRGYLPSVENITLNDAAVIKSDVFAYKEGTKWIVNRWLKSFSAPNATLIEYSAFSDCVVLTSFNAPQVEIIDAEAFWACEELTTISFPKATEVGDEAFWGCEKLNTISFPELTVLNDGVFDNCKLLSSVDFPKVVKINSNVFGWSENLTQIKLGAPTNIDVTSLSFESVYTEDITLYLSGLNLDNVSRGNEWKGYTWRAIEQY